MFKSLDAKGTRFLRGHLVLVVAGPGTGKSAFVLTYALKGEVPTLYFSADSDAFTQFSRAISIVSDVSMEQSANMVREGKITEDESEMLDLPIRFVYHASPSLDQIEASIEAYDALYEDYPALIVVDNITNVRTEFGEGGDPFSGLESLMDYLHDLARKTGSCVIGLHHVTGEYNNGDKPIPLNGIKNQIGRVPELVLTLHRVQDQFGPDALNVSTVKNRAGKMDPSGRDFVSLEFVGETMQIRDST